MSSVHDYMDHQHMDPVGDEIPLGKPGYCRLGDPNSSDHLKRVREFLKGIGHHIPGKPEIPTGERRVLWCRLLVEEVLELAKAAGVVIRLECGDGGGPHEIVLEDLAFSTLNKPDLVAMADGMADVSVVNTGFMALSGIDDKTLLRLVDENNLLKLANGKICPETGKFLKPKDHPKPDFRQELLLQGWDGQ